MSKLDSYCLLYRVGKNMSGFNKRLIYVNKLILKTFQAVVHRGAWAQACDCKRDGCGFDSYPRELIFPIPRSGDKTKRDVEFRHSIRFISNTGENCTTVCFVTRFFLRTLIS